MCLELFHDLYGSRCSRKKALPIGELRRLLYEDPKSERLRRTQAIAASDVSILWNVIRGFSSSGEICFRSECATV